MRLDKLQSGLARLCVDAELRALAEKSPRAAAAKLNLTVEELDEVASTAGLPRFAASLINKRLGQVRLLLPRTYAALGEEFDRRFRAWAGTHPTAGVKKHQRDAIRFAAELRGVEDPGWIGDVAAYEAAWIEARLGRRFLVRRFSRRVRLDPPGDGICWGLWLRLPGGRLRHSLLP